VEDLGLSKEELARRLGRSRSAISNLIRLLDLPEEALELIASGRLSEGHGRAILQARGAEVRARLAPPPPRSPPRPGRGARARRGGARVGARARGSRPLGAEGDPRRAPFRR